MSEPLSTLSRSVTGRVAIVTGAGSGIGRATARLLAGEGAKVACVDRQGALDTAAGINEAGATAQGWEVDVTDDGAVRAMVDAVVDALGPIDILVNNAGVSLPSPASAPDEAFWPAWDKTLAVNLTAYARLVRFCLPHLSRNGDGRVVQTASTEGLGATAYISAYTASKHAVIGLTRGLAVELARQGVNVNAVCPGPIRTGMTAGIPDEAKAKFARRRVPMGRYAEPEEVAHGIVSLCLPAASYITGHALVVDGGLTIQNT